MTAVTRLLIKAELIFYIPGNLLAFISVLTVADFGRSFTLPEIGFFAIGYEINPLAMQNADSKNILTNQINFLDK